MRRSYTGRRSCALSPYHQQLAAQARARADEMRILRARGLSVLDIAIQYGVSESVVRRLLKRYMGESA